MSAVHDVLSNNPPPDLLTGEAMREKLRDENAALLRRRDELLAAADRIPPIASDETAGRVSDFIKQLTALHKVAEDKRTGAKEPYLEGGRAIDGFFKSITDPVAGIKKTVEARLTGYLRQKEAEERAKAEAEARRQREAAAAAAREAAERAAALTTEADLAAALDAEKAADLAASDAAQATKVAEARPAEFSRTRGEYGAVASLRTTWTFDSMDRASLDLEALRAHLPIDGLEKAVRSAIKAGVRDLRGVRIYEGTSATVR